jgi:hypothetical protein
MLVAVNAFVEVQDLRRLSGVAKRYKTTGPRLAAALLRAALDVVDGGGVRERDRLMRILQEQRGEIVYGCERDGGTEDVPQL